jgi:hypothetical protein
MLDAVLMPAVFCEKVVDLPNLVQILRGRNSMAKIDVAAKTQKLYGLLKEATAEERQTIIAATLTLFGDVPLNQMAPGGKGGAPSGGIASGVSTGSGAGFGTMREFFDAKQPQTKLEQLAVAARHREQGGAKNNSKDDFRSAFDAAKRAFDSNNFTRDIANAKTAKLFNLGSDNLLSYYGELYVDALPDRDAAAAIKRPGAVKRKVPKKAEKKG